MSESSSPCSHCAAAFLAVVGPVCGSVVATVGGQMFRSLIRGESSISPLQWFAVAGLLTAEGYPVVRYHCPVCTAHNFRLSSAPPDHPVFWRDPLGLSPLDRSRLMVLAMEEGQECQEKEAAGVPVWVPSSDMFRLARSLQP